MSILKIKNHHPKIQIINSMRRILFFCSLFLFLGVIKAQTVGRSDTINVIHYEINLEITDFVNKSISGYTTLKLTPRMDNLNTINLDLLALNVDSVRLNQAETLAFLHNDTLIRISLNNPIMIGDTLELSVFYHGNPVKDPSNWGGFYFSGNTAFNLGVGFESIPHNFGRTWYPCIDEFKDKALYDYYITTKNEHKAVCGGLLMSVNPKTDSTQTFHWKMNQIIPTYLSSVAVGEFEKVNIPSSTNIPIEIYTTSATAHKVLPSFANLDTILKIYEYRYGPYLWDRVGYVCVPFSSGAMEHAANIAYPILALTQDESYESLYAHELSHHWWGNLITCEKAEEMWINEGFARYSEAIYKELLYPNENPLLDGYKTEIRQLQHKTLRTAHRDDGDYYALANVDLASTYGATSYDKGALVVHTLRNYMGDEKFFYASKKLLEDYAFSTVSSEQLRDNFMLHSGLDLNDFFDAWVFQPGFLHFSVDSLQLIDANTHTYRYTIRQKLHKATQFANSNKIEVQFFSQNREVFTDTIQFSGEYGTKTVQLPFIPVYHAVDFFEKISDAVSDFNLLIFGESSNPMPDAFVSFNVLNATDTSLVRVEHHWVSPNQSGIPSSSIARISNNRYWRIDGVVNGLIEGRLLFQYNAAADVDKEVLQNTSLDSICIAYRRDISDTWKLIPSTRLGSAGSGIIRVDEFLPGEYAIAIGDRTQIGIEEQSLKSQINIFPNPSNEFININNVPTQGLMYRLFDSRGATILEGKLMETDNRISTQNLSNGFYSLEILQKGRKLKTEKILIQ